MKLTIIGSGPGGYETALKAAERGLEVTLISAGPLGGTCLNEGCIPTKALRRSAEVADLVADAAGYGIQATALGLDLAQIMARKEEIVTQLRGGIEFLLNKAKVSVLYGRASFVDSRTVRVSLNDGGETTVSSDAIFVATGSVSASLPIPGAELAVDSTAILSLQEIPRRLCVIGAGVIGLEFASIYRSFGSDVIVLEYCKEILPRFDTDLSKRLKQSLSKKGISIETSAAVQAIAKSPDGSLKVTYNKKDQPQEVEADKVLMAVGRRPALDSLNFADIGIETGRGVIVDENFQTNIPGIYAFGDIIGGYMLAHVATAQGLHALNHLTGQKDGIDFGIVPAAVFTSPEAATVGLSEDDCKERGIPVKCLKSNFRANGKALTMGETDGFIKVVVSEEDDKILGCHLFGPHASDLIHEMTALIARHTPLAEFRDIIHAHPTLSEALMA
ncbi:MAG: dihydrolipoyl dehydrogenase [Bacteroidales bacterium]|nr:dihydrolipoyl dehydrogenase [Bacteroidales bacterium]